jgi:hypothetical protein
VPSVEQPTRQENNVVLAIGTCVSSAQQRLQMGYRDASRAPECQLARPGVADPRRTGGGVELEVETHWHNTIEMVSAQSSACSSSLTVDRAILLGTVAGRSLRIADHRW